MKQQALELFERSCLTGEGPDGEMMPATPSEQHSQNFMQFLSTLSERFSIISPDRWSDGLTGVGIIDIMEPLTATLASNGLSLGQLLATGREELNAFMAELPPRRLDMHLQRQVLKNPALKPRPTDLADWGALGPAAAYCDVLVCEKHFADMLTRDGFNPRAQVLRNVADLPKLDGTT